MTRRLGYAALAMMMVPALMSSEALAQRRPPQNTDTQQQPPPTQEKTFPFGASWSVVSLNGKPVGDKRATFQVDANLRGTGFGGCNTFSASAYPLREQGFAVGPIALTKRACDKSLSEFERSLLTALRAAAKWDLVDGKLVIRGGAGEVRLDRAL